MASSSRLLWIRLCALAAIVLLAISSLSGAMAQPRTILGWQLEHFLAYLAVTLIVCAAWSRPLVVAVALVAVAGLLELLQALTPDRTPNLAAALSSAGGVLAGAVLAQLLIRARNRRAIGDPKNR